METKPIVKLIGNDGNVFFILGACRRAAVGARWPKEKVDAVMEEMRAGDYDHLLTTAMKYFDVE